MVSETASVEGWLIDCRSKGDMRVIVRELFETVILALLIFLGLHSSVQHFQVDGSSMHPTLEEGDHVIVNKLVYLSFEPRQLAGLLPFMELDEDHPLFPFHPPRRGEVVIFSFPRDESRDFVKRVVGVPGDIVELRRGQVFVNGVEMDEPYIVQRGQSTMAPVYVEEDTFFVLGDNRRASNDSRDWGPVPSKNIIGRAWISFWPLNRWHALHAFSGP